jgi:hypothetical protein
VKIRELRRKADRAEETGTRDDIESTTRLLAEYLPRILRAEAARL